MIPRRGGALIPQVFNLLDASYTAGLGVGYVLPFLDYRVAIVLDAFYTAPQRSQTLMDPRLASGSYQYTMTQNDVAMFLGFLVHFTDLARDLVVPYAGLGARVHFLWSDVDGTSGGHPLGFHRETSTQGGGAIRVGCGIRVGPGLIALDVELGLAPLDHIITGGSNIGALNVAATGCPGCTLRVRITPSIGETMRARVRSVVARSRAAPAAESLRASKTPTMMQPVRMRSGLPLFMLNSTPISRDDVAAGKRRLS